MNEHASPPGLSLVIPAYNEERRLPATLAKIRRYKEGYTGELEVIVVDDGSTDGTAALVSREAAAMPGLHVLKRPHGGKGAAVRAGMLVAHLPQVILCDADLSMPIEQLDRFRAVLESGIDIAIGSRELPDSRRYREPVRRHIMGRIFNLLVRALIIRGLDDTQCGFKGFRRAVARDLFSYQQLDGFSFDAEVLFLAHKRGYSMQEVPIDWHFDEDSRVRPGVDTVNMTLDLLRIRYNDLRGRYRHPAHAILARDLEAAVKDS
ncbi:MAG TPA: dolichyl-phosphate beta-glucosyltransferase [Chloroflexota bacterium]|jgi:glycosyltransferase involved in cell wall biosynthesis|nr:dolichyl-phosphate beta-glucosyltransferase [Chloroflexota bacterium]